MAQYRILVFCTDCGRMHPARSTLLLDDGPIEKTTIADAYKNRPLPMELVKLIKQDILCPELANPVMLDRKGVLAADRVNGGGTLLARPGLLIGG
jgi:hypothetical protein